MKKFYPYPLLGHRSCADLFPEQKVTVVISNGQPVKLAVAEDATVQDFVEALPRIGTSALLGLVREADLRVGNREGLSLAGHLRSGKKELEARVFYPLPSPDLGMVRKYFSPETISEIPEMVI